ncbi:MAG: hypothetical protein E7231_10640 [Cellulosilyticum sp.]|nr:hypothetical protein [Cellulosilyticum sp.]
MHFPKHVLLLDIETTGLDHTKDQIISIGVSFLGANEKITTTHYFLEHPDEEKNLLQRFLEFLSNYEAIFTYYGKGFEFPFILARLNYHQLDASLFLKLKLIDMKNGLRAFAKKRILLEALFQYKRQCQSTGYDIVKLYRTYTASSLSIYKTCILEHQKEELESLLIFFELYMSLTNAHQWALVSESPKEDILQLKLQLPSTFKYTFSGIAYDMKFSYHKEECYLYLDIPIFKGTLQHSLEPLKDYYYIESQKQLIHKSLAQFIPATSRRKATKAECVISKESTYLKLATSYKITVPLWHDAIQNTYIEYSDFNFDYLSKQLFYLFFQNQSKRS